MEIQPSVLQDLGVEWRGAIPLESGDDVSKVLMGGTNFGLGADEYDRRCDGPRRGAIPTGDTGLFPLDSGQQVRPQPGRDLRPGQGRRGSIYRQSNLPARQYPRGSRPEPDDKGQPPVDPAPDRHGQRRGGDRRRQERAVHHLHEPEHGEHRPVGSAGKRRDHPPVHPPDHRRGLYPARALPGNLVTHREPGRTGPEPRGAHHLGTEVDEHGPRPGRADDHRGRADGGPHPDEREQGALAGRHPRCSAGCSGTRAIPWKSRTS